MRPETNSFALQLLCDVIGMVDRRKVYVIAFIVFAIHNPHIRYFRRCFSCTVTALRSRLMAAKKLNIQTPTSRGRGSVRYVARKLHISVLFAGLTVQATPGAASAHISSCSKRSYNKQKTY